MPAEPEYLAPKEVASILHVHVQTVLGWVRDGTLPSIRIVKIIRIPRESVLDRLRIGRKRQDQNSPALPKPYETVHKLTQDTLRGQ
jgi:excisionase family DNA binding protein